MPEDNGKFWLDEDGSIKITNFTRVDNITDDSWGKFVELLKSVYSKTLISPLFLGVMISIMVLIPKKLLRYHKNFVARCFRFSKKVTRRSLDLSGAIIGLMISSLIFLLLPILIKLDSQGSILFRQIRIGKNRRKKDRRVISVEVPHERRESCRRKEDLLGKPFIVYKFRSMKQNAEMKTGPVWASINDPRVTNIGKFLRPYHIDEIPQFVNVLKGEMSLVGPRPERPEFVSKLKSEIPNYEQRFRSKPGLTGLAQIYCGYDTSPDDVKKKLNFDLAYIKSRGLKTDIKIIWDTIKKISTNYKGQLDKPI